MVRAKVRFGLLIGAIALVVVSSSSTRHCAMA
jgi:hypothetical protein